MNILSINTIDIKGGAPRVAYSLKTELAKKGCNVSIYVKHKYSSDPNVYKMTWLNPLTRLIKRLTGKDVGSYLSSKLHRLLATDIEWFNTGKLLSLKEFQDTDLIHCHNLHGNYFNLSTLIKISRLKPIVWTLHDMWAITPHCAHAYDGKVKEGFYECPSLDTYQDLLWDNQKHLIKVKKKVYDSANFHIVVPCKWLKEKVGKSILKNHPVSLIYNGIDENVFKKYPKSEVRSELNLPHEKKIIMFASNGGAGKEKGGDYLTEIAKLFEAKKDVLFVCLGGIENKKRNNILFIPYISDQQQLAKYYSASDIFLFTSLAETFPLVILESLSCGLPVVTFDVGGVSEAVQHKVEGYIAKYQCLDDLVSGIEYIFSLNLEDYKKLSESGVGKVKRNFTLQQMVHKYQTLYQEQISLFNNN